MASDMAIMPTHSGAEAFWPAARHKALNERKIEETSNERTGL